MSGVTVVVQDAIGLRWPSTSTRHCRHAPTGSSSGWSQKRGIWMPISSAARITSVPLGTLTSIPSTEMVTRSSGLGAGGPPAGVLVVTVMSAVRSCPGGSQGCLRPRGGCRGVEGTAAVLEVREVLVAEVLERGLDRTRRTVAECAEGLAEDVVGDVEQRLQVLLGALAGFEPGEQLGDRKSTRLNSSHPSISYAVFCLKKKKHALL